MPALVQLGKDAIAVEGHETVDEGSDARLHQHGQCLEIEGGDRLLEARLRNAVTAANLLWRRTTGRDPQPVQQIN